MELEEDPASDLETDVLSWAMRDLGFARKARGAVDNYGFITKQRQWIWTILMGCLDESSELPSPAVWASNLKRITDEDKREAVRRTLMRLARHRPLAPKGALKQIRDFVRVQAIERGLTETAKAADRMEMTEAEGALHKTLAGMRKASGLREEEVLEKGWEKRLDLYAKPVRGRKFPTPLPAINRITRGGPGPGRLCLITAYTGVGKSSLSVDMAYTAAKEVPDLIVADMTTEETAEDRQARYDARITGIDREDLTSAEGLTPAQETVFRARYKRGAHIASRIFVKEIPPSSPVADVEAYVREIREKHPGAPLLFNLDSAEHIKPTGREESKRIGAGDVYRALKALCVAEELQPIYGWVTDQLGRQTAKKKSVGTEDIAESLDKARLSDFFLALVHGNEAGDPDSPWRPMQVLVRKSRLGRIDHWTITANAHLGTCEWRETADYGEEPPKDEDE